MKQNIPVQNTIRKSMAVKAIPRLVVEFNHNRYAKPTPDNNPSESVTSRNPDIFPVASLVAPHRPRRGAMKATLGDAKVSTYSPVPKPVRYHITSPEDSYKYWSSPTWSGSTPTTIPILTNLATRPIANAFNATGAGVTGYNNGYFGSSSVASVVAAGGDGPLVNGANLGYVRKTLNADNAISRTVWQFTGTNTDVATGSSTMPVTPGRRYRISFYARISTVNANTLTMFINAKTYDSAGNAISGVQPAGGIVMTKGQWSRFSYVTTAMPAGSSGLAIRTAPSMTGTVLNGETSDITGLMITDVTDDITVDTPYFDGNTTDPTGYDYAWTGTTNNSTSIYGKLSYAMPTDPDSLYATNTNPQVTYQSTVLTNKIVIGLENSLASPDDYDIYVLSTVGGAWTKIADENNTTIDSDGRIILYYTGSGWSQTINRDNHTPIAGIQLRVQSMNKGNQYLNVIEIAACLEKDISDYLRSDDDTFDLGDTNAIAPIGRISSNVASINLFNGIIDENDYTKGLLFNNENVNSIFYGLLRENAKFTLDYIFDATSQGGTDSEVVREFVMYAEENWSADLEESVNVSVRDISKILQEINAPQTFIETAKKMSVGEIVWRLLDAVGFVDYHIDVADTTDPLTFDFFWVTEETKVWDILNSIAEGTQTAIYVDSFGILQVKTKETAFDAAADPVWHIRGEDSGTELADLVSLTNETKEISNSVKITYRPTSYSRTANNNFKSDLMWEPETDTVILHSSDLQENLLAENTDYLKILAVEATDWPYKGLMQIEGELISYEGKEYYYIDSTDGQIGKYVLVKSSEDYLKYLYKTDFAKQYLNRFTGRLKITERGMWNSVPADHKVQTYPYTTYRINGSGGKTVLTGFFKRYGSEKTSIINGITQYETQKSCVSLVTATTTASSYYYHAMYAGNANGVSPIFYGTKFRIRTGQKTNMGGLTISTNNSNGAGYYIEFRPTAQVTSTTYEILVYARNTAGKLIRLNGKGARSNIVKDKWYTLDVQLSNTGTNHYIMLWLNGRYLGRVPATGTERRTATDAFGMYIRGSSNYEFEYLYAFDRVLQNPDNPYWGPDVSFYDRVKNGYVANQFMDEFTYGTRQASRRVKKKTVKYTQRYATKFYDEFGPVCHEVREFDINYNDKLPGKNVKLLATNEATAKYMDFRGTPFGAHFYAVNVSHNDTEIHGENESLGVMAQNIVQAEEKTVSVQDENSIRVSGLKELAFTSNWIQSEDQANNLGSWISSHWGSDTDEISVTIFGNPLIELTDVVLITDPQSARVAEKYFVIAASTDFDQGLSTTLRLRKVNV